MKFREILLHVILYFLEYSPGLKLNPISNWTRVNLPIQLEKFVLISSLSQFKLWWLWTMKLIKPQGINQGFTGYLYSWILASSASCTIAQLVLKLPVTCSCIAGKNSVDWHTNKGNSYYSNHAIFFSLYWASIATNKLFCNWKKKKISFGFNDDLIHDLISPEYFQWDTIT